MHTAPRLSVTVLNYNYGHFLAECLRSILAQTFTDFELIVIDDCSKDDSLAVIEPFLCDPRVRLIRHEKNVGFVGSLMEGAESSSSPYMTVVSADDLVLSDTAFERQIRLLDANPKTSFCYSSWAVIDTTPDDDPIQASVVPFPRDHVWSGPGEFRHFCTTYYILHTGTIIRRTAYEAVGGYDKSARYTIDNTMWAMLCGTGDVAFISAPLYAYRIHGSNMSRNPAVLRATVAEFLRMVDLAFANLPDGPVRSDRKLVRKARQYALVSVARVEVFAGRLISGWRVFAYAARIDPRNALLQRKVLSMAVRTLRTLFGRRAVMLHVRRWRPDHARNAQIV